MQCNQNQPFIISYSLSLFVVAVVFVFLVVCFTMHRKKKETFSDLPQFSASNEKKTNIRSTLFATFWPRTVHSFYLRTVQNQRLTFLLFSAPPPRCRYDPLAFVPSQFCMQDAVNICRSCFSFFMAFFSFFDVFWRVLANDSIALRMSSPPIYHLSQPFFNKICPTYTFRDCNFRRIIIIFKFINSMLYFKLSRKAIFFNLYYFYRSH